MFPGVHYNEISEIFLRVNSHWPLIFMDFTPDSQVKKTVTFKNISAKSDSHKNEINQN